MRAAAVACIMTVAISAESAAAQPVGDGEPYVVVLGVAQDGGVPQAGDRRQERWNDPSVRRYVSCLGIVDPQSSQRWLLDCTPDFAEQLHVLDDIAPVETRPGIDGIFLTHAHIGHYTGLMDLGHEVMGAKSVPVYAMPRMAEYLRTNGPWDQLVRYRNIGLHELGDGVAVELNDRLRVEPFLVPHRQEYSEVVGFRVTGPGRSLIFIPDIDSWEQWDEWGTRIEDMIAGVDLAFLDGTFYDNGEIPGRDMSGFPHPFVAHSMKRFAGLPSSERRKIHFIHFNHTNLVLVSDEARQAVLDAGFHLAREQEVFGLAHR